MKRVFFLLVVLLLVVGCTTLPREVPAFIYLSDINEWVYDNIRYTNVPKTVEGSQTPEQTLSLRSGNCSDMAILLLDLAKKSGYTGKLIGYKLGSYQHMICDFGSLGYYDPTQGIRFSSLPAGSTIIF